MKKILHLAGALLIAVNVFAQSSSIPNPSFENWSQSAFQNPTGYRSSNNDNTKNGYPVTAFQDTSAYHGSYAVELKNMKSGKDTLAAYISNGDPGKGKGGIPISGTPTGIRIYYKYQFSTRDTALILVEFKKNGVVISSLMYQITDTAVYKYKLFTQLFSPALSQAPDTVIFAAASSVRVTKNNNGPGGGWDPTAIFRIDSVTFEGISQPSQMNGDFEKWVNDTVFTLQQWNSNMGSDSGEYKRTTDAESGSYAVELTTGPCGGCGNGANAEGITTGKPTQMSGPTGGQPYTMPSDSLDTLEFYYKYIPSINNPNDTGEVSLDFHKGSNHQFFNIYMKDTAHYKKVDFPIDFRHAAWFGNWRPDSVMIGIQSSYCRNCMNGMPSNDIGSDLKVDNFRFKGQVDLSVTPANPSFCAGSGGVTITASGATTYTWSPSTGLSATTGATVIANPLFNQSYTVTGKTGTLTGTQKITVTVNSVPTITINPNVDSICNGSSTTLTASGASTYSWKPSKGLNDTVVAKVTASPTATVTYTVSGTSTAGCTGANAVTVKVNSVPTVTVSPSSTVCYGSSATLVAGGASKYTWSPSTGLSATSGSAVVATPTATTTYTVTGTNSSGCSNTATVTLTVNPAISVTKTSFTSVTCYGSCNGSVNMSVSGGTSPYTYSWNTGPTTMNLTGQCAGTYTLTATDKLGCTATDTVKINQPTAIAVGTLPSNTTCGQANGQATASPSGGTAPYKYSWSTVPVQTTITASGLAAGSYTVTVTDKNGCTANGTVTIGGSSGPAISSVTVTASNCGTKNGTATATVSGGATPYTYSWNNGQSTATADSLAAGVYIITVTDKNSCSTFKAVTVSDTNGPSITVGTITQVKCNGQSTGAISVSVSGGKSPYKYSWSNGATTASISNLSAGPYQITVADAFGCTDVKTVTITQPAALALATNTTQASCGMSDGSASVSVSGGTTSYAYTWSTGATTSGISSLAVGTYSVKVTDGNGCLDSAQASVSNASGPVVTVDTVINGNCSAGTLGTIIVSASGGTPPYSYLWNTSATKDTLTGLSPGNYAVQVTDAGGCAGTANATILQSVPPAISICMVTVDPTTNYNTIIWNKAGTKRIAQYNIYKETTTPGVYNKIGSTPATGMGTYVDSLSDARKRSWRYEISQVDSCGNESALSKPHKTMHLTINIGAGNSVNLVWDNYEGLSFGYYIVYRDSVAGLASDSIDYVTNSGIYTYTDYPNTSKTWYYHMGISNPGGCTPAIEAINYNSSKSNTGNVTFGGGPTSLQNISAVSKLEVYPNPTTGMFSMSLNLSKQQNLGVKIYNALGQLIEVENYGKLNGNVQKQFDVSAYGKGVYFVQVTTDNGVMYRKVVVQ